MRCVRTGAAIVSAVMKKESTPRKINDFLYEIAIALARVNPALGLRTTLLKALLSESSYIFGCMFSGNFGRSSVSNEQLLPRESRQEIHRKKSLDRIPYPTSYLCLEL